LKKDPVVIFIEGLKQAGIDFVASLPSRSLSPVIDAIARDSDFIHVPLANEEDGIGICAGAWIGGKRPALLVQSTGFVKAVWPLLEVTDDLGGVPLLLVVDYRGGFGEVYPQYFSVGHQTPKILASFHIPYTIVQHSSQLIEAFVRGEKTTEGSGKAAVILLNAEDMQVKLNW